MKKIIITILLCGIMFLEITGCVKNIKENKPKVSTNNDEKLLLKLERYDDEYYSKHEKEIEDNNKTYDSSMIMEKNTLNITGINFENIDNESLKDHETKYLKVIDYIRKNYPDFDSSRWNIAVNMFAKDDGNGLLKLNYQIKNTIGTNKSIVFSINNNVISDVTFVNMEFEVDEDNLINLIDNFKNTTIQEKKKFEKNEKFYKDDIKYIYYYNTEELIYTYQLYFYVILDDDESDKIINNEYGTEFIVNKKIVSEN